MRTEGRRRRPGRVNEMEHMRPADIERTSMQIIDGELESRGILLPAENAAVIKRVIHTTADFDFAETMRFTPDAVRHGIRALLAGGTIVTDTNMALAGVSRPGLAKLGACALCYMAEPDIAAEAKEKGVTRAAVSVQRAVREHPGCIFASGNAPTALTEIVRQMEEGFRPALVIGVPVGFVNVTEAKEMLLDACLRREVPAIVSMGRKGGSSIAAAILNALIYQAAEMQDPSARSW